ncbi:MAG: ATP-binding cassette domain-containing protein [Clostridiales Family XIII bacterium]|jgi:energy-coupling factor transport system ATP-binding protein|nr:ATP-binding cassette domain-containing protein [Clostridiales Family XIII bacterium]
MALVAVKNLSFTYPERTEAALRDISFTADRGEFVVVCGKSGCGKSTLLRHLKTALTPYGERAGAVFFDGRPLSEVDQREQTSRIGFVLQSPENQIVTDKVWHELAFGLESLGEKTPVVRRRVAEMTSFFGIQEWYDKKVTELSGGQKQILSLASVMAMQPDVLVLDEPTSQLDPIAAEDFIETLKKINDEIGVTIILSEHRLEGALPRADRAVCMAEGRVICEGSVTGVGRALEGMGDPMLSAMPAPMRVYLALEGAGHEGSAGSADDSIVADVPKTVREGRIYLERKVGANRAKEAVIFRPDRAAPLIAIKDTETISSRPDGVEPFIAMKDVWFRYERGGRDIVRDLSFTLKGGEFVCIVGGNGTGKTTMLGIVTGANGYWRGKARVLGLDPKKATVRQLSQAGLAALPQDPQTLFTRNTIFDNLVDVAAAHGKSASSEEIEEEVRRVCELTDITDLVGFHPYDVSGGEQQRSGLAMALLARPKLLLLDEPTKGMDNFFKEKFAAILERLAADGMGVLMVSHDVEFCAKYAERCALFFNGGIVSEGEPREFFSGNSFYTTSANRMSRGIIEGATTAEEIVEYIKTM